MSAGVRLWVRVGAATACAAALLVLVEPPHPSAHLDWPAACALGLICGGMLAVAVTRATPRVPGRRCSRAVATGIQLFVGLAATNEEIVWRRLVLGELLTAGPLAALAGSTVGFALVHRSGRATQLVTGLVFGTLYLATGALVGSIAAHWTYNAFVGAGADRRRAGVAR